MTVLQSSIRELEKRIKISVLLNCLKLILRESPVDANSWKDYNKGKKAARQMM